MKKWIVIPMVLTLVGCSASTNETVAEQPAEPPVETGDPIESTDTDVQAQQPEADTMLEVTMNRIDGTPESLATYEGKVVLVVNVASKCGLTPQYDQLEAMYNKYKDDGLVILGFPANDFGAQEPGTNAEIMTFCTSEYGVSFPMFEKIAVTGDEAHPFYKELAAKSEAPSWNFTKYLIDRRGQFVERIDPRTTPDDAALVTRVEELLNG